MLPNKRGSVERSNVDHASQTITNTVKATMPSYFTHTDCNMVAAEATGRPLIHFWKLQSYVLGSKCYSTNVLQCFSKRACLRNSRLRGSVFSPCSTSNTFTTLGGILSLVYPSATTFGPTPKAHVILPSFEDQKRCNTGTAVDFRSESALFPLNQFEKAGFLFACPRCVEPGPLLPECHNKKPTLRISSVCPSCFGL